jgi:hypothetical protein
MLNYPKYKYSKEAPEGFLVNSAKEELALSDEWVDNPADIPAEKPQSKNGKK